MSGNWQNIRRRSFKWHFNGLIGNRSRRLYRSTRDKRDAFAYWLTHLSTSDTLVIVLASAAVCGLAISSSRWPIEISQLHYLLFFCVAATLIERYEIKISRTLSYSIVDPLLAVALVTSSPTIAAIAGCVSSAACYEAKQARRTLAWMSVRGIACAASGIILARFFEGGLVATTVAAIVILLIAGFVLQVTIFAIRNRTLIPGQMIHFVPGVIADFLFGTLPAVALVMLDERKGFLWLCLVGAAFVAVIVRISARSNAQLAADGGFVQLWRRHLPARKHQPVEHIADHADVLEPTEDKIAVLLRPAKDEELIDRYSTTTVYPLIAESGRALRKVVRRTDRLLRWDELTYLVIGSPRDIASSETLEAYGLRLGLTAASAFNWKSELESVDFDVAACRIEAGTDAKTTASMLGALLKQEQWIVEWKQEDAWATSSTWVYESDEEDEGSFSDAILLPAAPDATEPLWEPIK